MQEKEMVLPEMQTNERPEKPENERTAVPGSMAYASQKVYPCFRFGFLSVSLVAMSDISEAVSVPVRKKLVNKEKFTFDETDVVEPPGRAHSSSVQVFQPLALHRP